MAIIYPDIDSIGWGDDVNDNFRELSQNDTDIKTTIGTETMGTTATTLKGAIAEHEEQINNNTTQLNDLTNNKADKTDLLDYEEGTWTPTINGVTYTTQTGYYIKIGKLVTINFSIQLSAKDSSLDSNGLNIYGLPYRAKSEYISGLTIGIANGIAVDGTLQGSIKTNFIAFRTLKSDGSTGYPKLSNITDSFFLVGSCTYICA